MAGGGERSKAEGRGGGGLPSGPDLLFSHFPPAGALVKLGLQLTAIAVTIATAICAHSG